MNPRRILLLDLDNVLLFSRGYRAALRGAVAYFGRRLGYPDIALSEDDIDVFEAVGMTAEWDSATVCVCLLLAQVWQYFPDYTVGQDGDWKRPPEHRLPVPPFRAFVAELKDCGLRGYGPIQAAEDRIIRSNPSLWRDQTKFLQALLHGTRQFDRSPIHRIVQEFNLGSRTYAEVYAVPPNLTVEGSLLTYDRPSLDEAQRDRLMRWTREPGNRAVVFTNRPSTPPDDAFDTPEAEIGMRATGLADLKVVGGGGLTWLGLKRSLPSGDLLKPSPTHALAGLRLALGDALREALESSAALALDGSLDPRWSDLNGAELHVFEDSAKGLRSAMKAVEILREHGISMAISLYGVSDRDPKRAALADAGAALFYTTQTALARVRGLEGIDG